LFKLETDPEFWSDVKLRLPGGETAEFKACFTLLTARQWDDFMKADMEAAENDFDRARRQMIARVLTDWRDVVDPDDGTPMGFTPERLEALTAHTWFQAAVVETYVREITGQGARKN